MFLKRLQDASSCGNLALCGSCQVTCSCQGQTDCLGSSTLLRCASEDELRRQWAQQDLRVATNIMLNIMLKIDKNR